MSEKQKKRLRKIIIAAVLFALMITGEHTGLFSLIPDINIVAGITLRTVILFILYLAIYIVIGSDVVIKAVKNIKNGSVFDENFLMTLATVAAFAMGEFTEGVAVMLFYQVGEFFQDHAVGKSRESITEMMSIAPEYANLVAEDGSISKEDPEDVEPGSIIVIKPGEKVPLDGVVTEGESFVDTAALTGESVPRRAAVGDEIISGCVNGEGTLRVRVTKAYEESTVARILELVENAGTRKARIENFITRFAKYYTPVVTIGAVLLALIPPLVLVLMGKDPTFFEWVHRGCVFLIVSCPCALVISVPLGFFGGIGAASKKGVLIKGSNYLELAGELGTLIFDKTGTLTKGEFAVSSISPALDCNLSDSELIDIAAHLEGCSSHPIAASIVRAYEISDPDKPLDVSTVSDLKEHPGRGVSGVYKGRKCLVGNAVFMEEKNIVFLPEEGTGTVVYVAGDGQFLGYIVISDTIKENAREAISRIKHAGIKKTVMLTGDRRKAAAAVAGMVGLDEFHSDLLPADKVSKVEDIMSGNAAGKVGFVGDGINDAPVLMRADVGFAMGSMGSDAAIEAADIVIMDDDITKIATVIGISRKTMGIVKMNVVFAIGVKILVLILGALGIAGMWAAVFADVGVAVLAILNSMRALNYKDPHI